MQRLEVSGAVRRLYGSLGVKGLNNNNLPQADAVKYPGIHLDKRLTWRKHKTTKRMQPDLKLRNLHWTTGRKSQLSLENKLLVYKVILKPVWTYGIQLWGTAWN